MKTPASTNLPIAFKTTERQILQAAARRRGLKESTYVRVVSLAAARAEIAPPAAEGETS